MNIDEITGFSMYIGGGVYLIDKGYDGYHYWLITTDGISIQNKIALDMHVAHLLVKALTMKLRIDVK